MLLKDKATKGFEWPEGINGKKYIVPARVRNRVSWVAHPQGPTEAAED